MATVTSYTSAKIEAMLSGYGGLEASQADLNNRLAELDVKLAENDAKLLDLNTVRLPALQADLDANDLLLADLNDTRLPNLEADLAQNDLELENLNTVVLPDLDIKLESNVDSLLEMNAELSSIRSLEKVKNGGFETDFVYWTEDPNVIINFEHVYEGDQAAEWLASATIEQAPFPVVAGEIWRFEHRYKTGVAWTGSAANAPRRFDAAGVLLGDVPGAISVTQTEIWTHVTFDWQVDSVTASIHPARMTATVTAGESLYVDDFRCNNVTSEIALDAALAQLELDLDVAETKVNTLETVTLPNLQAELDAAELDVSSLEGKFPITAPDIAAGAVTANAIFAGAVVAGKIAAGAVTAAEVSTDTLTANEINAGAITASEIFAGAVVTAKLAAGAVTANEVFTNTLTAAEINANAINTSELNTNAVWAIDVNTDTLTANEINAGAITSSEIATDAVTAVKVFTNTLTANEINTNAITTSELNTDAVTAVKVFTNTLTANEINANAITASEIATDAVTANDVYTNTLTANEINTNAITASELNTNAVTAVHISTGAITTDKISAGAITADKIEANAINGKTISGATIHSSSTTSSIGVSLYGATSKIQFRGKSLGPGIIPGEIDVAEVSGRMRLELSTGNSNTTYPTQASIVLESHGTTSAAARQVTIYGSLIATGGTLSGMTLSGGPTVQGGLEIGVGGGISGGGGISNFAGNIQFSSLSDGGTNNSATGAKYCRVTSNGSLYAHTNAPSSRDVKHDINPLKLDYRNVLALEAVTFRYNDSPKDLRVGFIAEDARDLGLDVLTSYEDPENSNKVTGFDYDGFDAALLLVAQKHDQRIEKLERTIKKLEGLVGGR